MKLSVIMPVRNGEPWILKAIKSIPERPDIEIIVVDDDSEDGTLELVETYKKYTNQNILILHNDERLRMCGSINKALDVAQGEFVVQLDCDDYLNTENFNELLNLNRTEDLQFFCNRINNGDVWNPEKKKGICDHICLYKRSFVGDLRHEYAKFGSGWNFHQSLLKKPHTESYFNKICYYYNFPREGSNYDLGVKGLL